MFVRPAPKAAPNTAVHLLVDRSPSMSARVHADGVVVGSRSDLAWDAALALALALEGIPGVNPAVTAFPGALGARDSVFRIVDHGVGFPISFAYVGDLVRGSSCSRRKLLPVEEHSLKLAKYRYLGL